MRVCYATCKSVSKGFKKHVGRSEWTVRSTLWSFFWLRCLCCEPCDMLTEEQVGITHYANSAPGFRGVLKQRYTDFIVNEVDLEGNVVHLSRLHAADEATEIQVEVLQDDQGDKCLNFEQQLDDFGLLAENTDVNLLRGLLIDYLEGKKEHHDPIVLCPDSDKLHRKEVHMFFKDRFSFLVTDTVDGPDSRSKCVRVRVLDEKCNDKRSSNGKRLKGSSRKTKSKRPKLEDGYQGFDSRGADLNWPSERGKYLQFHLYKENKDTQDALLVIGKMLGNLSKSFGIAGTKDKRAVTTQKVTVFKQNASRLAALNKRLYGIKVGNFSYVDKALALGQLSGNQFTITLRGVEAESNDVFKEAAVSLGNSGFINYFGLQRFGTGSVPTFTVGAALLRGEWEAAVNLILQPRDGERQDVTEARAYFQNTNDADGTFLRMPRQFVTERAVLAGLKKSPSNYLQAINCIPRTMRMMYIHSYQSYLWNHAASKRISVYGLDKVVEGDLVMCVDSTNLCLDSKASSTWEGEKNCSQHVEAAYDDDEEEIVPDACPNYVRHVTADDVSCQKFGIHDVVLPLPGSKTLFPKNDVTVTYEELVKKDFLNFHQSPHNVKDFSFVNLPGSYRRLVQETKDFDWKILKYENDAQDLAETDWDRIKINQGKTTSSEIATICTLECPSGRKEEDTSSFRRTALQVKFMLPSSCYATMVLRELMKISSSVNYHKMLTEDASERGVP